MTILAYAFEEPPAPPSVTTWTFAVPGAHVAQTSLSKGVAYRPHNGSIGADQNLFKLGAGQFPLPGAPEKPEVEPEPPYIIAE